MCYHGFVRLLAKVAKDKKIDEVFNVKLADWSFYDRKCNLFKCAPVEWGLD